jgi:hypothetical protein
MTVNWQKLRVPLMERLALAEMAEKRGKSEEELLAELIREAVKRDLVHGCDRPSPSQEVRDAR